MNGFTKRSLITLAAAGMMLNVLWCSAAVMVLDVAGQVGSPFGPSVAATVRTNTYSGLFSGLPSDFFLTQGGTITTINVGADFTARFTFDLGLMPPAVLSTATNVLLGEPAPSHIENSTVQWSSATLNVAGFTFATQAASRDIAPLNSATHIVSVNTPLQYGNVMSYGTSTVSNFEAFQASSSVASSYFDLLVPNVEATSVFRLANLDLFLVRSLFGGVSFLPAGIPTDFTWTDTESPFASSDLGFAFGRFFDLTDHSFLSGTELLRDVSLVSADFNSSGLRITSARAFLAVPAPGSLVLVLLGLATLGWCRNRSQVSAH